MGNANSTRWKNHTRRRTVEECRRITPHEARHVGAATTTTPIASTKARRLWALCECGARVLHLYRLPEGGAWKCKTCQNLIYRSAQTKGTRAAFATWSISEEARRIYEAHPARERFYQQLGELWREIVAPWPFNPDGSISDPAARREALEWAESEERLRAVYENRRGEWTQRMEVLNSETGAQIQADVWAEWKRRTRHTRRRITLVTMEARKIKGGL